MFRIPGESNVESNLGTIDQSEDLIMRMEEGEVQELLF